MCSITFKRIIKNGSTEEFSGIPYTMAWMNCILYAWYGLPFISENNLLVSTINAIGAALETVYVLMFIIYAPKNKRNTTMVILVFGIILFIGVALISFALHGNPRKHFCGIIAAVFSVMMYASPLSVIVSNLPQTNEMYSFWSLIVIFGNFDF